ncbi:hypothetical protein G7047_27585 [Diaphorobacter sp. HDW4A]|uniref:hypothetical protein n=1 Tax=Diaphorobacter sp. HDW4A TaxID=2714924 RepID=UPI00140A89AA|nr:hypothetical protein [Diaphorobacter sp. HDW4A]QIL83285.1 hypothetical protein G7047_27585 [Diaphorobacter sp. HDW4A]
MMKKSIFALAVATVCAWSGMDAQAVVKLEGAMANGLQISESGVGHFLIVPYFTTQSGNAMLLSLINMDEVNGKAVKLRFRSARNADTLFDFQVFLAPGDMWTANVSQNGAGLSFLTTIASTFCAMQSLCAMFIARSTLRLGHYIPMKAEGAIGLYWCPTVG